MLAADHLRTETVERHVKRALDSSTDPEVRYHLRQALQVITE